MAAEVLNFYGQVIWWVNFANDRKQVSMGEFIVYNFFILTRYIQIASLSALTDLSVWGEYSTTWQITNGLNNRNEDEEYEYW
jgi:hypothetical protein